MFVGKYKWCLHIWIEMYPYLLFQIDKREARLIKYLLKCFLCCRCRGFYVVTKFMISLKYIHTCIFYTKNKYIYSTIKITLPCFLWWTQNSTQWNPSALVKVAINLLLITIKVNCTR